MTTNGGVRAGQNWVDRHRKLEGSLPGLDDSELLNVALWTDGTRAHRTVRRWVRCRTGYAPHEAGASALRNDFASLSNCALNCRGLEKSVISRVSNDDHGVSVLRSTSSSKRTGTMSVRS